jgi:hypothetical protein
MKWINVFFSVIFLFFAALQYNDPDPYVWVPIYLYAAFLCWQASKGKFHDSLYIIGMFAYTLYATYLFYDQNGVLAWANEHAAESLVQSMEADKPWIEETREFGGLLIVFSALLMNYIVSRKLKPAS